MQSVQRLRGSHQSSINPTHNHSSYLGSECLLAVRRDQKESGRIIIGLVLVLALLTALYFSRSMILGSLGSMLVVRDEPQKVDAIVVLLGAVGPDRVIEAHELYKAEIAPVIAFGSGFIDLRADALRPKGLVWHSSAERYAVAFESLGLSEKDVEIVDTSEAYDTSGELEQVLKHAVSKGWNSLLLVTSAPHSRRVELIWQRLSENTPVRALVRGAPAPGYDDWWTEGYWQKFVAYEYGAFLKELPSQLVYQAKNLVKNVRNYLSDKKDEGVNYQFERQAPRFPPPKEPGSVSENKPMRLDL